MNYWLVKQEPDSYSFDAFTKDGKTDWTGVRNFTARNNLKAMKKGDKVFYYHSNIGKEIVGMATVSKEHFPDKTAKEGDWVAVELEAGKKLKNPVTLAAIKANPALKDIALIRLSRLSVVPITKEEFDEITAMSK
jgi:predicted RNA-binding protein with PUA-like domain